jgi:hypothetical protein
VTLFCLCSEPYFGLGNSNTGTGIGTGITNITTESDLLNAISGHVSFPKSQQFQILKIKQHQKPVPLLWLALHSQSQSHKNGSRISLVVPVLAGAAYNDDFYVFYKPYAGVLARENVTRNLYLLSNVVTDPKIPHFAAIDASAYAMRYSKKASSIADAKK